jgi:hypothetical protein
VHGRNPDIDKRPGSLIDGEATRYPQIPETPIFNIMLSVYAWVSSHDVKVALSHKNWGEPSQDADQK